ncbi:MAG: hypothetical protein LBT40_12170 [Deltaproteobacteria bacterium]|jgi:hypothetical protein|nr:hypothetical protein [Deltaproteobacteria bacterium]
MDLVRPNDEIRVGGEVESQCRKCGRATTHRVVSMKEDGVPYKCECLACKSKHVFRKPVAVEDPVDAPAAKPQTVSRKKGAAPAKPVAAAAEAPAARDAQEYSPDQGFAPASAEGQGSGPDPAQGYDHGDFRGAVPGSFQGFDQDPGQGTVSSWGLPDSEVKVPAPAPAPAAPARPSRSVKGAKKEAKPAAPETVSPEELEDVADVLTSEEANLADDVLDEDDEFVGSLSVDSFTGPDDEPGEDDYDPYGVERALGSGAKPVRPPARAGSRPARDAADGEVPGAGPPAKKPAAPRARPATPVKDRSKGLEDAESILRREWEEMRAASPSKVAHYTLAGTYSANQHIDHPQFGLGIVKRVILPNKISVNFERGLKTLIMMVPPAEPAGA